MSRIHLWEIDNELMFNIATYMDDDIRESLHINYAPCSNEKFLAHYLESDPLFAQLLEQEFNIECRMPSAYFLSQLDARDFEDYPHMAEYVKSHNLTLRDFDCWKEAEIILGYSITYEQYRALEQHYDCLLLTLTWFERDNMIAVLAAEKEVQNAEI